MIFDNLLFIHSIDKEYSTVSYNNLIYRNSDLNLAYSLRNFNPNSAEGEGGGGLI